MILCSSDGRVERWVSTVERRNDLTYIAMTEGISMLSSSR
jgi:hypothetical protein